MTSARAGRSLLRGLAVVLLAGLLLPMAQVLFAPAAQALSNVTSTPSLSQDEGDDDEDASDYSLYQLASNASSYFSNENSPENDKDVGDRMGCDGDDDDDCSWRTVTQWPGAAGSLLGYADADSSMSFRWLTAGFSGSSQTVSYSTFSAVDGEGDDDGGSGSMDHYEGLVDYVHFGAANNDLGLDSMSGGSGFSMTNGFLGSIVWVFYALSVLVSMIFFLVIQLLKIINPFRWFYAAVKGVNPELAEGMTQGKEEPGALSGLSNFIAGWYGLIVDISWLVIVPLFLVTLVVGMVLFKKMNRGRALKRFVVRVLFIGLGLPIIGSMYTQVLNQFDDSVFDQHSGSTRVVLSTYVDFEAWMTNDRLLVPDDAVISWEADNKQAGPKATMSVRTTALAINTESHPSFSDMSVVNGTGGGGRDGSAESAWKRGSLDMKNSESGSDFQTVMSTFGIINRYISDDHVEASDFESGIKSTLTQMEEPKSETKKKWFTDDGGYDDAEEFGEDGDTDPNEHPMIVPKSSGLNSNNEGGVRKTFQSNTSADGCGHQVWQDDGPAECNMSPLSAYNYLNTSFGPDSLTMYSSDRATSGFQRESHSSVSQVGTGPVSLMYWANTVTLLASIVVLGLWYGLGMLVGSVKRTFSVVAAVPFATLGAMGAISKVIIYSTAMILEVLVTLFLYQLVSEFLISFPGLLTGPVSQLTSRSSLLGDGATGAIAVILLTFLSTFAIIAVTFALLRARKVSLRALDEAVTKMVDRFLETDTPPPPGGGNGGMMPALGRGIGSGAGMAAASRMGGPGSFGGGGGGPKPTGGGSDKGQTGQSTNAGGTNGPAIGSGSTKLLGRGSGRPGDSSSTGDAGSPGGGSDGGRGRFFGSGRRRSDKQAAVDIRRQGGLSNLGYGRHGGGDVVPGQVISSTSHGSGSGVGAGAGAGGTGRSGAPGKSALGSGGRHGAHGTGGRPGRSGSGSVGSSGTHFGSGQDGKSGRHGSTGSHFGADRKQLAAGSKDSTQRSASTGSRSGRGARGLDRSSATSFGSGQTQTGRDSGTNSLDRSKIDLVPSGNKAVVDAAGGEQRFPLKGDRTPGPSFGHGGDPGPSRTNGFDRSKTDLTPAGNNAVVTAAGGEQRFPLKGEQDRPGSTGGGREAFTARGPGMPNRQTSSPMQPTRAPSGRGGASSPSPSAPAGPRTGGGSRGPVPSPGPSSPARSQPRPVASRPSGGRTVTPPPSRSATSSPPSSGSGSKSARSSNPKPLARRSPTTPPGRKT